MSAGQAEQVVADFIAAIEKGDIDAALGYMATDAEYDNVPMSKAIGHDEIRATLAMFVGPDNPGQFEILRQAATGNLVMNERIDRLQMNGKAIEVQVAGVWQVDGDKITLWRDYFDMGQVTSQLS
jgi:limonene-1,2-epoxide hydrolase